MSKFILTRTPLRVSFAGGGTDLNSAVKAMGQPGLVLNMAINKYVYITLKEHSNLFDEKYRLNYSQNELLNNREDINNRLIKETLKYLNIDENLYISSISDIPAGTGLGSSSAFTIGLLNALHAYKGEKTISQIQLADEAVEIESKIINSSVGSQDQYGCAIGGLKFMQINDNHRVDILLHDINHDNYKFMTNKLILVWTDRTRSAQNILEKQDKKNHQNKEILLELKNDAQKAHDFYVSKDLKSLVNLIDESWQRKKKLVDGISNNKIEETFEALYKNNIKGCKVLGAGGGGFVMGFNLEDVQNLQAKLSKKIIYIKPDIEGSVLLTHIK